MMIKKFLLVIIVCLMSMSDAMAQEKKVQNRPYTDLRTFHFGIHIGTHMQDIEFVNVGPQMITDENGNVTETVISCDQDRMDPGFNVGVLGELRISENLQLRIAPSIYFGSRHLTLINHTESTDEKTVEKRQDLKSAYVTSSFDLIFAAPRYNNHRVYLMAGVVPSLNLTNKSSDYLRLNRYQTFVELGLGLDRYLPYFKCRPELKFMFGLGNALDTKHPDNLRDKSMVQYARSVREAKTKMFTLTFYFE